MAADFARLLGLSRPGEEQEDEDEDGDANRQQREEEEQDRMAVHDGRPSGEELLNQGQREEDEKEEEDEDTSLDEL
jgi:hypothetical protein